MTGLVGSLAEAWGEVRVHRARVVLSLVGVVLAVFAMTVVTAAGSIARQVVLESAERAGGRSTTLSVTAGSADALPPTDEVLAAYESLVARFGITQWATVSRGGLALTGPAGSPRAGSYADLVAVDPAYGTIHRIQPARGRYLVAGDADRLAPALVVNEVFLSDAGLAGAQPPLAVTLPGDPDVTAVVVGVLDGSPWNPEVHLLRSALPALPASVAASGGTPSLEVWVPPEAADAVAAAVPSVLAARGLTGEAYPLSDPGLPRMLTIAEWSVRVLSLAALALGATGVLNIGVVTVRQRIREIGIRRALGASSARVFAAVVLESVCATAAAGLVGVALAVALVVNLPLEAVLGDLGISDVPAFPVSAAVEALLAATAVGALVGVVPATIAVRARVVDAIRY